MRNKLLFVAALSLGSLLAPVVGLAQEYGVTGISVSAPPPPPRVEVRPAAPSPNHVWANGHWAWEGGRHVWFGGHWVVPPSPYHRWIDARWVNEGGRNMYYAGHWQYVAPQQPPPYAEPVAGPEVYAQQAPPADIVEVRPMRPAWGAVWAPGHWYWSGMRYQWAGGHWERERVGHAWEPAHWVQRGPRWVFQPAHWR